MHVALDMGHNNDKAMLVLTSMKEELLRTGQRLLGDRGYYAAVCVIPDDTKGTKWNYQQMGLCSVVERVIGNVMKYGVACSVFQESPEQHALALMAVYHIVEHALSRSPLVFPT